MQLRLSNQNGGPNGVVPADAATSSGSKTKKTICIKQTNNYFPAL
jgi:hypothetical protein